MKKLVCANEVKAAAEKGQKMFIVDCGTLITPAAKDLAKELGVEFAEGSVGEDNHSCKHNVSSCENNGPEIKATQEDGLDRAVIYQVVKAVLTNKLLANALGPVPESPFLTDCEKKSGLKIVRGRTVKFENFATGNPSANVAYREVISKNDSLMSAGFLTIEKSSFDWELGYEEIDIILEGSLSITINNQTYEACQGDVIFVPKDSKVTWSSSGYVKLFHVTYPANWPELIAQ